MQKITPHLWYDKEAKEAAGFYCSIFPDSKITNVTVLHDTPSGDCDVVSFELAGQKFMSISAGPLFKFNPSISFMVNCETADEVQKLWDELSKGGKVLMPLDKYFFSEKYGWIQDKYGLSWQLIKSQGDVPQKIIPSMLFVENVCGKAEEATNFYQSVFRNSRQGQVARYPQGMEPDKEGTIMFSDFMIENQWFAAMDSAREHNYGFNEAISFMVNCDTQEEIDYYWEKLSTVPESEQCGWCKDIYGVIWQITPTILGEMMTKGSREQVDRVTQAFLPMKKFDIAGLEKAYEG